MFKESGVKRMQKPMRSIISTAVGTILTINLVQAGSFSLYTESSGAAIGNNAAGIAAEAADATTGWYNPAGLAFIHHQELIGSGIGLFPSSTITGMSRFNTPNLPTPFTNYIQSFHSLQGAKNAFIPALHYAYPLSKDTSFGFSVVTPFGLSTDWSRQGPVRYAATHSGLMTTDFSPEIGTKINEHFALGLGIDLQYAQVKFNQVAGSPALGQLPIPGLFPSILDTYSDNKGHSFSVGFHAGAMLLFNNNHTRAGVNYQSTMQHKFHGYSQLRGPLATPGLTIITPSTALGTLDAFYLSQHLSTNTIRLPDVTTLSLYQDLNQQIALLGSAVYTGWHTLRSIQLNNVAGFANGIGQVPVNSTTTENYRNVWRAAVGMNYRLSQQLLLRVGGGYDQTPTINAERDIRLADTDRIALSIGGHYQVRQNIGIDVGYTHLFQAHAVSVKKTTHVGGGSTYTINARAKGYADIVGIQGVWILDTIEPTLMTK